MQRKEGQEKTTTSKTRQKRQQKKTLPQGQAWQESRLGTGRPGKLTPRPEPRCPPWD